MPLSPSRRSRSTGRRVLQRDKILSALRKLVREHPSDATAAGQRLDIWIRDYLEGLNAAKRSRVRRNLALLDVAKARVLGEALSPPDHPSDPSKPDDKRDDKIRLQNYCGWLRAAGTGQYGGGKTAAPIDLRTVSAVEAFVHAQLVNPANEKQQPDREDLERSLDPDRATNSCATPGFALWQRTQDLVKESPSARRSLSDWWIVALIVLCVAEPEFKPESVGLNSLPAWERVEDGWCNGRSLILRLVQKDGGDRAAARFWLQAERASARLFDEYRDESQLLSADRAPGPAVLQNGRAVPVKVSPNNPELALTEDHEGVLAEWKRNPRVCLRVVELHARTGIGRGKLSVICRHLESAGFLHRPHGKRKGFALTAKGRGYIGLPPGS